MCLVEWARSGASENKMPSSHPASSVVSSNGMKKAKCRVKWTPSTTSVENADCSVVGQPAAPDFNVDSAAQTWGRNESPIRIVDKQVESTIQLAMPELRH